MKSACRGACPGLARSVYWLSERPICVPWRFKAGVVSQIASLAIQLAALSTQFFWVVRFYQLLASRSAVAWCKKCCFHSRSDAAKSDSSLPITYQQLPSTLFHITCHHFTHVSGSWHEELPRNLVISRIKSFDNQLHTGPPARKFGILRRQFETEILRDIECDESLTWSAKTS